MIAVQHSHFAFFRRQRDIRLDLVIHIAGLESGDQHFLVSCFILTGEHGDFLLRTDGFEADGITDDVAVGFQSVPGRRDGSGAGAVAAETAADAGVIRAVSQRRILPEDHDRGQECGTVQSLHFLFIHVELVIGIVAETVPVAGEIMPFVQMDLGLGITVFVEQFADHCGGFLDPAVGIGGVAVVAVEIQRSLVFRAVFDEVFGDIRLAVESAMRRSPDLQVREPFFQLLGDLHIESVVFVDRAQPHQVFRIGIELFVAAAFRLVPDFPILDLVFEPVPQSFRVVTDDVRADVDPFLHIGRRVDLVFFDRMVDGFAEAVENRRIRIFDAVPDIVVGVAEIVVARIVLVEVEQRENMADVDQPAAGVGERGVVQTGKSQIEFAEGFPDVAAGHFAVNVGRQIAAVEFADLPGLLSSVPGNRNRIHDVQPFFSVS